MSNSLENIISLKQGCERALRVLDKIIEIDEPQIAKEVRNTFNGLIKKCDDYLNNIQ